VEKKMKDIPFHKTVINKEAKSNLKKVIQSGWLTTGNYVQKLEEEYCKLTGANYALAVSSATAGLSMSLKALHLKKNIEVYVPTYTFVSTINAIEFNNLIPRFIDNRKNFVMPDYKNFKKDISVIMPVSIGGIKPELSLTAFQIYDYAHMPPIHFERNHDFDVYSLYATKPIGAGEGGIICTNNKVFYERLKTLYYHGIGKTTYMRREGLDDEYDVENIGYKFNMTDITAAIALGQLKTLKKDNERRKEIHNMYRDGLSDMKYLSFLQEGEIYGNHLAILLVSPNLISTGDIRQAMLKLYGIHTSRHFKPVHTFTYYKNKYKLSNEDFPNAYQTYKSAISLPIYPSLTNKSIKYIIKTIKDIVRGAINFNNA
jgi:dTDP-4-amino-4,6-dideoxygalactose transaminase